MNKIIIDSLRQMKPAGPNGFEGLIAQLLKALTGHHFRLAKSGSQAGRDISSRDPGANVIAVECKRYGKTTELKERELLGELVQVVESILDLDLWILVTSRDISSQLYEVLYRKTNQCGIEFLAISDGDGTPSSLDILCAQAPEIVLTHFTDENKQKIQAELTEIANTPHFKNKVAQLKEQVSSPLLGYDNWRSSQNKKFVAYLKSERMSRANFGQPINCEGDGVKLVPRKTAWQQLDTWLDEWDTANAPYILLGEEGDGKTWCVASWLSSKIQSGSEFPAVLFLTSVNVTNNDPASLLPHILHRKSPSQTIEYWDRRLNRWLSGPENNLPVFLLVLDGINERRRISWWRTLLEELRDDVWCTKVAVLITCRQVYWERYKASLQHIQAVTTSLPSYDDNELNEALSHHNLSFSNISANLLPLIRKPRYFDLMVKYQEQISSSGDVTIARLIYEDWRDRLQRKRELANLDHETFQDFIRDLATKYQEEKKVLREQDIVELLPPSIDDQIIFEELRTGGILRGQGDRYEVDEQRLVYGLALLLIDQLETESAETHPEETLAKWLEPHAAMDIKARICEFAALHALSHFNLPLRSKVALLHTWVNNHNAAEDTEEKFTDYLPLDPKSYIQLAEIVWSDSGENHWAQDLLMRAFIRWRESPSVISELTVAFNRWLSFVHMYGFPHRHGGTEDKKGTIKQQICDRVGLKLQVGESFNFAGYSFSVINDDGLLRLGRVTLAVISYLPRESFIQTLAIGCIAEAIMNYPDKYALFKWVMLTSKQLVWSEVEKIVRSMLDNENIITYQVAYRLLSFEGSPEAYQLQKTLPQNLFPPHPWHDELEKDSCTQWVTWDTQKCEICIQREDLDPQFIARQLKAHCINPDLRVPDNLGTRLSSVPESISVDLIWSLMMLTQAGTFFDLYEPALCAYAPNANANFIRRVVHKVNKRDGLALRQLSLRLPEHYLFFNAEEHASIYKAWLQLIEQAETWEEAHKTAELFLFKTVLKGLTAEQQLMHLLKRPDGTSDLLTYEKSFLPITDWDIVWQILKNDPSDRTTQRTLWFVSAHPENIPRNKLSSTLLPLMEYKNSLIRSSILRIIYFIKDDSAIATIVNSAWAWDAEFSEPENRWGSLLLSEYGTYLSYTELRSRIHPIYLGYAVRHRGMKPEEVNQYAIDIHHIWTHLSKGTPPLPENFPDIKILSDGSSTCRDRKDLSQSNFSKSVTFFMRHACWGGRGDDMASWHKNLTTDTGEQHQVLLKIAQQVTQQQVAAGNTWFARRFYTDALEQVVAHHPDLTDLWLQAVSNKQTDAIRILRRGHSFYAALCQVLLREGSDKGFDLYWLLQDNQMIRVVDTNTKIWSLDFTLFQAPHTEKAEQTWTQRLQQCTTDRELMEIAILAQWRNGKDWLWSYVTQGIESPIPQNKALAMTLLGFIDSDKAFIRLNALVENQPNTWVKQILTTSIHRWQSNNWAKHWYHRFLSTDDNVNAWAAFRLLLQCVDTRFWFWYKEFEASSNNMSDARTMFFRENSNVLSEKIKKNEESLTKHFLAQKVLTNQAWPWMQ